MFKSDRHFRLWDYRVSHNQALIRSPATPEIATNIDMVFWGVEFLSIPSSFDGVELRRDDTSSDPVFRFVPSPIGERFYIISNSNAFVIIASGYKVLENRLDIFESSLEGFAATEGHRELGDILAHS